jgi:hypothetical protein
MSTTQHHLSTLECAVLPGGRAELVTPRADAGFEIAVIIARVSELRFLGLKAFDSARGTDRTLFQAPKPQEGPLSFDDQDDDSQLAALEDSAELLPGVEFDDFLLALMAEPEHEDDTPKRARVRPGEELRIGVCNPTAAPIVVKVKFSGPGVP